MSSNTRTWNLDYSIHQSEQEYAEIWKSYDEARERKNMSMFLPSGVSVDDFLKTWLKLDYGAPGGQKEPLEMDDSTVASLSRRFVPAIATIKRLRNLARKGKVATQAEGSEGLPKVVWGQRIEDTFETADGFGKIIFQDSVTDSPAPEDQGEEKLPSSEVETTQTSS